MNKRVKSRYTFREQGRSETVDTGKGVGREDVSISEVLVWLWLRPLLPSVPAPVAGCAGMPPAQGRFARFAENLCRNVGSLSGGHNDIVESSSDSISHPNRQHFMFFRVFHVP